MDKCNFVKNLVLYRYKMYMYCIFISVLLEVSGITTVEIITLTLKIPAKVPLLVGLVGAAQILLMRCYAVSNLNSAECLFSMNFPFKCAS